MSKSLPLDLSSRHALITGASGAIGNAIASAFEAYGATCVRSDIDATARVLPCDVTDENAVAQLFERSSADTPLTDVIHAAGICPIWHPSQRQLWRPFVVSWKSILQARSSLHVKRRAGCSEVA